MSWSRHAKIAFIGSHGIRKTTAALAFASVIQRAGRSVEFAREVVRDNPLGINESATCEAQLWVLMSQVRRELELSQKAECVVTDRGVMDNFAYYLRACSSQDPFDVEPLVRAWSRTYDLVVRLTPDVEIRADGVRSTSDRFRDEVEAILDARLPRLVPRGRLILQPASQIDREPRLVAAGRAAGSACGRAAPGLWCQPPRAPGSAGRPTPEDRPASLGGPVGARPRPLTIQRRSAGWRSPAVSDRWRPRGRVTGSLRPLLAEPGTVRR